jgi:hypothetical protein
MTQDKCLVCFDPLNNNDKLVCNHYVHKNCIIHWIETVNNTNKTLNKPLIKYGLCPFCKTEQRDIEININEWIGTLYLNTDTINYLKSHVSFIPLDLIPDELLEQLKDACDLEKVKIVNTIFSLIKLNQSNPKRMKIIKYSNGCFSQKCYY